MDDFRKMLAEEGFGLVTEASRRVVEVDEMAGGVQGVDDIGESLHEIREAIAAPSSRVWLPAGARGEGFFDLHYLLIVNGAREDSQAPVLVPALVFPL